MDCAPLHYHQRSAEESFESFEWCARICRGLRLNEGKELHSLRLNKQNNRAYQEQSWQLKTRAQFTLIRQLKDEPKLTRGNKWMLIDKQAKAVSFKFFWKQQQLFERKRREFATNFAPLIRLQCSACWLRTGDWSAFEGFLLALFVLRELDLNHAPMILLNFGQVNHIGSVLCCRYYVILTLILLKN